MDFHNPMRVSLGVLAAVLVAGCLPAGRQQSWTSDRQGPGASAFQTDEQFGKTYYLDGAGNWGFGNREVPRGLMRAGYQGDVEVFIWTGSFNPLIDQCDRIGPPLRARILAKKIVDYRSRYPDNPVNLIALSAGTGVATWAVEDLPVGVKIDNLVLLGSSLSADYDISRALDHITGNVYVYHSPNDWVLSGPVKLVGTIDGKIGADSAGLVGLKPPSRDADRVVNIPWSSKWTRLGWTGAHTDCTNERFVRSEIAKHIIPPRTDVKLAGDKAVASGDPEKPDRNSEVTLDANTHVGYPASYTSPSDQVPSTGRGGHSGARPGESDR